MPSNEGHIHWDGTADSTVNHLGQELRLTSGATNGAASTGDPVGTIRIRAAGSADPGLALPGDGWEPVPGTVPILEVRQDGHYPVGYIRIRQA